MLDLYAESEMVRTWIPFAPAFAAFVIGFTGSGHCAGMCGSMGRLAQGRAPSPYNLASYQLGRLITYSLLGGLIGTVGGEVLAAYRPGASKIGLALLASASIWSAFQIVWPNLQSPFAHRTLHKISEFFFSIGKNSPKLKAFSFGIGTAFLPCGFLWGFLIASAASAGFFPGALILFAFGLGTTPALGVFQWLSHRLERRFSPKISAGIWLSLSLLSFATQAGILKKHHPVEPPQSQTQDSIPSSQPEHTHCH